MCDKINQLDAENYESSLFPQLFYRTSYTTKPELTVSNLIQFIPNILTYDFEMSQQTTKPISSQTELPPLTQSLSFVRAQSLMMSITRSQNHRMIKINLNLEKNSVKCQEYIKDCFNLASKYEINMIYYFYQRFINFLFFLFIFVFMYISWNK